MEPVTTIRALADNYIYLYRYDQDTALAVDPGQAGPVLAALDRQGLALSMVLATHNHFDHIGGARELKKKTGCRVLGPDRNGIPGLDHLVRDGQLIELPAGQIEVIATPGHTATSVCYYVQPAGGRPGILFTGDTLFVAGCGRPIECDARTMWSSLRKIAQLPDDTLIYPGHDYTAENCQFALTILPGDEAVEQLLSLVTTSPRGAEAAVPSTLAGERLTNVFLGASSAEVKRALGPGAGDDAEAFAELRRRKNIFG